MAGQSLKTDLDQNLKKDSELSHFSSHLKRTCPYRLAWSRTSPFHGENRGSNPLRDAILRQGFVWQANFLMEFNIIIVEN